VHDQDHPAIGFDTEIDVRIPGRLVGIADQFAGGRAGEVKNPGPRADQKGA